MWQDDDLLNAVKTQNTLQISSLIISEFNLNDLENIKKIGNYRYRPESSEGQFLEPISTYDEYDIGDYYTDADVSYQEFTGTDENTIFKVQDTKEKLYYSLGDCFLPFRPRSGINKARMIDGLYIDNIRSSERPRYYMPSSKDYFKYWSSYRKEDNVDRGISSRTEYLPNQYLISDACPFIVYDNAIFANRVVVKMQTNVGSVNLGTIRTPSDTVVNDPLYDYDNATVPRTWKIQKLDDSNTWVDLISFDGNSTRSDGTQIVSKDGHVEIFYGISIPQSYINSFYFQGYISSSLLPTSGRIVGEAYVVGSTLTSTGQLKIWNGSTWETHSVSYGWSLYEDQMLKTTGNVMFPVDPIYYQNGSKNIFKEFDSLYGLRVVVRTMNSANSTFDLIEISPRISVDISKYTESFDIVKVLTNDQLGIPVGDISVSNGNIVLTDFDEAFLENNTFNGLTGSILSNAVGQNVKFTFYEKILNVNGSDKHIPIKTLYSENFPRPSQDLTVSISLRDLFFRLETTNAPSVLSTETTLTFAISQVLDYIGFSNYVFKNISSKNDPIIEYFFVEPDVSVAEILRRLAVATQTAIFFDEYNNLVVMSKEYLLPDTQDREIDFVLYGNESPLPNIESISNTETNIINDGQISYTTRYIQREVSELSLTYALDEERTYRYKPVLLWEVSGTEQTKTKNESTKESSSFSLGALALNVSLNNQDPVVVNREITNNVIDVGESIYWLPRFQGYFYSNGEIIRFESVEFAIPGRSNSPLVWISSNQEYQRYFSELGFNGKIYPTGRIKIYSEPYYETIGSETVLKNGKVRVSGRSQFGTQIANHEAGLSSYWSDNSNTYGVNMDSSLIFSTKPVEEIPVVPTSGQRVESNIVNTIAKRSSKNGIIKNFLSAKTYQDGFVNTLKTTSSGTVQSSALVFKGPSEDQLISNHRDMVSYIYKDLSNDFSYRHFGTRMRILGQTSVNNGQIANGSVSLYSINPTNTQSSNSIDGGAGGIAIMVDPQNGSGYYFEIVALDVENIESFYEIDGSGAETSSVHNILFYKVSSGNNAQDLQSTKAVPQKLWGGLGKINVDYGIFAGQNRLSIDGSPTVYDLAVEYQDLPNGYRKFYLYINNNLVKVVEDKSPLPVRTTMAPFVRGGSQCMFENVYAVDDLVAKTSGDTIIDYSETFADSFISVNDFLRKYALSGIFQSTVLSNTSPDSGTRYKVFFEEFGTILRECYYFNIEYDQAYPAFYSSIAKTFTNDRSYTVSGFYGGPYEAEFLVFNASDKEIVLDETTGSFLRIIGIAFTQETTQSLTVDSYFKKVSSFSDPSYEGNELVSPQTQIEKHNKIKASRAKHGVRQFSLESIYVQSQESAENIMGWIIDKTMRPRKEISMSVFPMPQIQLGDIVTIEYTTAAGTEYVSQDTRFIVVEIQYSRSPGDVIQNIRMVEV